MNLYSYKKSVEEAEALLKDAKNDYVQAVIKAIESGNFEEISKATWREVTTMNGGYVYCSNCGAISPNKVKHLRCPNCGARMDNFNALTRFHKVAPQTETVIASKTADSPRGDAASMLSALKAQGLSYNNLSELLGGAPVHTIENWMSGRAIPRKVSYDKIKEVYTSRTKGENNGPDKIV